MRAAVAPEKGGELTSLAVEFDGEWRELLYMARDYSDREGWTGKAPLLWPATGRNFPPDLIARREKGETFHNGAYELGGKRYEMPIHGFARDLPWMVTGRDAGGSSAHLRLELEANERTREWYPFDWVLVVDYVLRAGEIDLDYEVQAAEANDGPMPFSIGNHITFNVPFVEGTAREDMVLVTPSSTELLKTSYGIPTGEERPRSHALGIPLGEFERGQAVSLTGYPGTEPYVVLHDPAGLTLRMSHTYTAEPALGPWVAYNVWGDAMEGYFSPEPWVGLQNSLQSKRGLVVLAPGETFHWTVRIEIEREDSGE